MIWSWPMLWSGQASLLSGSQMSPGKWEICNTFSGFKSQQEIVADT